MKYLALLLGLFVLSSGVQAACTDADGDGLNGTRTEGSTEHAIYSGACTEDNEILIETGDTLSYDVCTVVSSTGAIDVFTSLSGAVWETAATSLVDLGGQDTNPVLVTVALRKYAFPNLGRKIRVTQNGTTDAAAILVCKEY